MTGSPVAEGDALPEAEEPNISDLGRLIADGKGTIDQIAEFVSLLMPQAVDAVNAVFAPRQLAKKDRLTEPLPIDKRQLSSYRTRLGTILEYALSRQIDVQVAKLFGEDMRLTFAVAHEYPDFFLRDIMLNSRVRIEMKAVDADSDEQSARFEVLNSLIQRDSDLVLLIGWEWQQGTVPQSGVACEYPYIFSYIVVPAAELANERDQSVHLRGGRVDPDRIWVPKKNGAPGELTHDKGNAGKILRLVHQTRRKNPFSLSKPIQEYIQFVTTVGQRVKGLKAAKGGTTVAGTIARDGTENTVFDFIEDDDEEPLDA